MKSTANKLPLRLFLQFLLICLLFLTGCDFFEDLFSKDEPKNDPQTITDTGTLVIGSGGGTVSLNNMEIKVPAGAFTVDNDITINSLTGDDGFGENAISSVYQLEGLPESTNKPIKIVIKYNGTLTGEPLLAIGEVLNTTTLDSAFSSFYTELAVDSAGYLIYELPAYTSLKSTMSGSASAASIFKMVALGGYKQVLSSKGHFKVSFPLAYNQYGSNIGENLEIAYDLCENMGFKYYADRSWPVKVLAKGAKKYNGRYSYKISKPKGKKDVTDTELRSFFNLGRITINTNILSDDEKLRTVCGHEFLHLVQNLYEFSTPNIELEQKWLKEATSVWIMDKFALTPDYVPHSHNNKEKYLFDGWQYSGRKYSRNGYGLSPIIKGISERYGDKAVVQMFENIKNGTLPSNAVDPVDAVLSVITEPIGNFWHGVLGSYVLGDYYNKKVNFKFLDDFASFSHFTIDPANNKIPINLPYHDLSGRLFKILPGDFSSMNSVPLSFTIDDPANCGILVCKYKQGTEITAIGEVFPGGNGQVIINDAKPVFDDGYEIVVMVSNCALDKTKNYQGTNNIELVVEITEPEVSINWVQAEIILDSITTEYCWYAWNDRPDIEDCPHVRTDDNLGFKFILSVFHTGSFNDNVYSGTDEYSLNSNDSIIDNITITFNDGSIDLHADKYRFIDNPSSSVTINTTADCNEIPLFRSYLDTIAAGVYDVEEYYLSGSSVSNISASYSSESTVDYHRILSIQNCSDKSYIRITVGSNVRYGN